LKLLASKEYAFVKKNFSVKILLSSLLPIFSNFKGTDFGHFFKLRFATSKILFFQNLILFSKTMTFLGSKSFCKQFLKTNTGIGVW